jgi:hypothetical protein
MMFYRGRVSLAALQNPGAPRLSIASAGAGSIRLAWPSAAAGFVLQSSTNLNSAGWNDVVAAPTDDGTNWSVIVSPPNGPRFYRLRD